MASPEILATLAGSAIAGWDNLILELSAGPAGMRVLQVLLDQAGQPLSAGDHVLYWSAGEALGPTGTPGLAQIRHEGIGGRFESDGTFRGTCWSIVGPEPPEGEEPQWQMTPREPSASEVGALRSLVAELLRRQAR